MMTFKHLNLFTTVLYLTLFIVLLFKPDIIFALFEVESTPSAAFISRRVAMLFFAQAVFLYSSRNITDANVVRMISTCIAITMLSLAGLGTFELVRGVAGFGILLAIVAETILGLLYLRVVKQSTGDMN